MGTYFLCYDFLLHLVRCIAPLLLISLLVPPSELSINATACGNRARKAALIAEQARVVSGVIKKLRENLAQQEFSQPGL